MSFGHALYYPHIHLTNKNWVKHALLFWDKISRIVPSSVEPNDSEDIISIKYHTGFIEDYHPERYDTSDTFNRFSKHLKLILESDNFFRERYEREGQFSHRYPQEYNNKRNFFADTVRATGTYIHVEKLDDRLKRYLFDIGLAVPGEYSYENWVKVDNEIGLLYMTYFAKTISKNKTLPIVTDIEQSFSATIQFEAEINSDYKEQFEYQLGNLLIQTVVPKRINDIPLDRILEFRDRYGSERAAFFKEVSDLADTIPKIDNSSALNDALHLHGKIILKETERLKKLYSSHKIETVNKFLGISLPTTLASGLDFIPDNFKPWVAAGGVTFGIIAAANTVKKEKLELTTNPKSYLLNLHSELSNENLISRINEIVAGVRKW